MESLSPTIENVLRFIHWNKKVDKCLTITYFNDDGNEIFNFSEILQLFKSQTQKICILLEDKPPSDLIREAYYIFDKSQLALTSLGKLMPTIATTTTVKELDYLLMNKYVSNRKLAVKTGEIFVTVYAAWFLFRHLFENRYILKLNNDNQENIQELINFSPIFINNINKRKLFSISN
jgi:hypothetical protein